MDRNKLAIADDATPEQIKEVIGAAMGTCVGLIDCLHAFITQPDVTRIRFSDGDLRTLSIHLDIFAQEMYQIRDAIPRYIQHRDSCR